MTTSAVRLTECPNCGAALDGAFCARCGQKASPLNPSIGEFLHDLFHELAHFDGKIVQSVRLLLTRPGFLSREHFEGRRARYIAPIRLYLVFSILYFAVAAFAPGAGITVRVTPGPGEDPQQAAARRAELQRAAGEAITHWAPRAMFVLVPVFAGLIALAARRSGRNYPQHLYFAMHVHAAWFFAGAVAVAARLASVPYVTDTLTRAAGLYGTVYFVIAFRRTYGVSTLQAILRTAAIAVAYFAVVIATLMAIALPVIMRKSPPRSAAGLQLLIQLADKAIGSHRRRAGDLRVVI